MFKKEGDDLDQTIRENKDFYESLFAGTNINYKLRDLAKKDSLPLSFLTPI